MNNEIELRFNEASLAKKMATNAKNELYGLRYAVDWLPVIARNMTLKALRYNMECPVSQLIGTGQQTITTVYDDWFLPSRDELVEALSVVGGVYGANIVEGVKYWSSSEVLYDDDDDSDNGIDDNSGNDFSFLGGGGGVFDDDDDEVEYGDGDDDEDMIDDEDSQLLAWACSYDGTINTYQEVKSEQCLVRPIRVFTIVENSYSLDILDNGQAGIIFYRETDGTMSTYYEIGTEDIGINVWSNIVYTVVGTSVLFGMGYGNSAGIVVQDGHEESAANDCLLYSVEVESVINVPVILQTNYVYTQEQIDCLLNTTARLLKTKINKIINTNNNCNC